MSNETITAEVEELEIEERKSLAIEPSMAALIPAGTSLVDQLQKMDDYALVFKRRVEILQMCREVAIKATQPEDWVLNKAKDGSVVAMLKASGAEEMAKYYGIQIYNVRPLGPNGEFAPEIIQTDEGVTLRAWCDARSMLTGQTIHSMEASRSSTEKFIGRVYDGELVKMADLRASLWTLLTQTKPVRILAAASRMPEPALKKMIDTSRCTKGSGYGRSDERAAESVTDDDVKAKANELGNEILARVGGNTEAAKQLLQEITAWKGKDGKMTSGFDTVSRITKGFQVKNAWVKLREHVEFGDSAQGQAREPGSEG